jgi:hypothetical protein
MARRRKKNPYKPGVDKVPPHLASEIKQLGLPTPERSQQGDFDVDQIAQGAGAGVLRARVKTLFMLPDQKSALIEQAVRDMRAKGMIEISADDIIIPETSMDRNFLPGEYDAISWFVRVHAVVEGGSPSSTNYSSAPRSDTHNRLPFSEQEEYDRREYAYVHEGLPEAHLVLLDWVSWCMFPGSFEKRGKPPSKVQVAQTMFDASDAKYLRGGVDGHFKAVCQLIAHCRSEYDTRMRRIALVKQEYTKYRRIATK